MPDAQKSILEFFPKDTLPIGFGCGGLLNQRRSRREAVKLIETAIDSGITYFDTARMYGAGRAEGILGEIIARESRDRLILASKAGIFPESRSLFVRGMARGIRSLHRVVPSLRRYVPVPSASVPRTGAFKVTDIRTSIEHSLRDLKTDYLDIFLLHECQASDVESPELLDCLECLKLEGKIRTFGIATQIEEAAAILDRRRNLCNVVQIPSSIWDLNVSKVDQLGIGLIITHSFITSALSTLLCKLSSDEAVAAEWRLLTQVDPNDSASVAQLLLAHALVSNPNGIVLLFSANPSHIAANAKLAKQVVGATKTMGRNALLRSKNRLDSGLAALRARHQDRGTNPSN